MYPAERERPFRMTTNLVRALRSYAHGRKGLDQDTYRLHLQAVGARSTLQLTRTQHQNLLKRLGGLPDMPHKAAASKNRGATP